MKFSLMKGQLNNMDYEKYRAYHKVYARLLKRYGKVEKSVLEDELEKELNNNAIFEGNIRSDKINSELRSWGKGHNFRTFGFDPWKKDDPRGRELEDVKRNNEIRKRIYTMLNIKYDTIKEETPEEKEADAKVELIKQFEEEWINLPNDMNGEHMDDKQIAEWLENWKIKLGAV